MTMLLRHEPWALFNELSRAIHYTAVRNPATDGKSADWSPAVDITEFADHFELNVDVPGVDPSSIDITLEKGVLTLSGSRGKAVEAEGAQTTRRERAGGRFSRRFNLPESVDAEAVSARNAHGVLSVTIPKRPAAQARKIAVSH